MARPPNSNHAPGNLHNQAVAALKTPQNHACSQGTGHSPFDLEAALFRRDRTVRKTKRKGQVYMFGKLESGVRAVEKKLPLCLTRILMVYQRSRGDRSMNQPDRGRF